MARNPNRMQEAVDTLMGRFHQVAAVIVTYGQGAASVAGISATVGRTPFEIDNGGVLIGYESRDYFIAKPDLNGITPANGDIVTEANGDRYEVSVPRPNNVYESVGPDGSVFKIHTKAIS